MTVKPSPYEVVELPYGPHMRPTKKYPNGSFGNILTPEELAVWEHVLALRAENQELDSALDEFRAEPVYPRPPEPSVPEIPEPPAPEPALESEESATELPARPINSSSKSRRPAKGS